MSNYILIKNIDVQNANAVAGFTWGFPAITHFLGFTHHLERKLKESSFFPAVKSLEGVGVISHNQKVHLYGDYKDRFIQSKNPPYLPKHTKNADAPIIEEGKMNMTVSLLIPYVGRISENIQDTFLKWIEKQAFLQRLAGGTILSIESVEQFTITDSEEGSKELRKLKREILPGYILRDRAEYLSEQFEKQYDEDTSTDMLNVWLDFSSLKYKARPQSKLISQYFLKKESEELNELWQSHLREPYSQDNIPEELKEHFNSLVAKGNKDLLKQWELYINPTEKTNAEWELIPKYHKGWLVPVMNGYKAISQVYANELVENTRDNETDICFVEASHSVAEWQGVNRIKSLSDLTASLWKYHYQEDWYLCQKMASNPIQENQNLNTELNEQNNYLQPK